MILLLCVFVTAMVGMGLREDHLERRDGSRPPTVIGSIPHPPLANGTKELLCWGASKCALLWHNGNIKSTAIIYIYVIWKEKRNADGKRGKKQKNRWKIKKAFPFNFFFSVKHLRGYRYGSSKLQSPTMSSRNLYQAIYTKRNFLLYDEWIWDRRFIIPSTLKGHA